MYQGKENITAFHVTIRDQVWATTSSGRIIFLDEKQDEFIDLDLVNGELYKLEEITTIYASPNYDLLLIGTKNNGVILIDIHARTQKKILISTKESPLYTREITRVGEDEFWIATFNGIYIYNVHTKETTHLRQDRSDPYSISNNAIKQIYEDKAKGIWICTDNGGISYAPPSLGFHRDYNIPGKPTIQGDIIHDICMDKNGILWIGTEDAGINQLDTENGTISSFNDHNGLSQSCIHGLTIMDNKLWIGTHANGIDVMDIPTQRIVKHYALTATPAHPSENEIIVYIHKTRDKRLLVATATGLYLYQQTHDRFEPLGTFPDKCRIQTIVEDHKGDIWLGTASNGLYRLSQDFSQCEPFILDTTNLISNRTINHIYEDEQHNLWFATGDGLKRYDRKSQYTTLYTIQDGLPSNVTYRIEEDSHKRLWISTANGLVRLNPQDRKISVFKKEHGLLSDQFNYNSSFKAPNGKLYFGTLKGMVSFHPDSIQELNTFPKIYITGISYADHVHNGKRHKKAITFCQSITLRHDQATFHIDYTALNFQAPKLTRYAYQMKGLSDKWTYMAGENRAYFTELPPGEYTFMVKATNLSGTWSENPTQFHILILPPWWRSGIAFVFYGLLLIGLCILFSYDLTRREKRRIRRKVRQFEHEKERELYKAKIDFFINIAHEIRTPLSLIIGPLEKIAQDTQLPDPIKGSLTTVKRNANRLLNLVNQLLDFRKAETEGYKLNFTRVDIVGLLKDICEHFRNMTEQSTLHLDIDVPTECFYAYIDKEAYTKILSNLLSNAVKYARSHITVRLETRSREQFFIDISNDGTPIPAENKERIFEPFFRGDDSGQKPGTGLGLPLARSLAEMHEGELTLENTTPDRTCFRLTLPINHPKSLKVEESTSSDATSMSYIHQEERPSILIVEDNIEMLHFIAHEINQRYNVVTANNGEEAIKRLKELSIQLVISDIMMPIMDGLTLVRKIKTELEFSHIPIILLTAKSTLGARVEGLELGADAYIDKPFSMDLLLTQVANLLNNRNNMRSYYFHSPIANLKSIVHSKADEKFLEKLNDIIDRHLSNENLDVDTIAELMHLSRPTLYRKISGLSDLTPRELIKISRLKRAAELILKGEMRIYEISEAVGFSSQSYFSRTFSKQFGKTPTQYAKENGVELK